MRSTSPASTTAALDAGDIAILATAESITDDPAAFPPAAGRAGQAREAPRVFPGDRCSRRRSDELHGTRSDSARTALDELVESIPTTMVMEELPAPRATHVLIRGQYDQPGPRGRARRPGLSVRRARHAAKPDRLGLARWLVDPANPLTARVAVNRDWQMLFGTGLVKTVDDFGAQGEPPSHPGAARLAGDRVRPDPAGT